MATALVHIGTHKTGTSSLQVWLENNRDWLAENRGIHLFKGAYGGNPLEIGLWCLRPNRTIPISHRIVESRLDEWRDETELRIRTQLADPEQDVLITSEALSMLRYPDEVERFAQFLGARDVRLVVCLRDRAAFLESYRRQLLRTGSELSPYRSSHAYLEPDTWVTDWDAMLATWGSVFGAEAIRTLSYEEAMADYGSTIPAVLDAWGFNLDDVPSWKGLEVNRSPSRFTRAVGRLRFLAEQLVKPPRY